MMSGCGVAGGRRSSTPDPGRALQRSRSLRLGGGVVAGGGASNCGGASRTPLRRQLTDEECINRNRPRLGRSSTSLSTTTSPCLSSRKTTTINNNTARRHNSNINNNNSACDTQSLISTGSDFSTDTIARNGTTFSARCNKYVLHCAKRLDDEVYLTPTQRSTRDLKRLRSLLERAHVSIRERDAEIDRLKRLLADAATTNSSNSQPQQLQLNTSVTSSCDLLPPTMLAPSVADSGNYDCLTSPSGGSKESVDAGASATADVSAAVPPPSQQLEQRLGDDWEAAERWIELEEQHLRRQHAGQLAQLSASHQQQLDQLQLQLSQANQRYTELQLLHQKCPDRACASSHQMAQLSPPCQNPHDAAAGDMKLQAAEPVASSAECRQVAPHEKGGNIGGVGGVLWPPMYAVLQSSLWAFGLRRLHQALYKQQASLLSCHQGSLAADESVTSDHRSVDMEPAMRLQFLRSAVYHLLTDRASNHPGHVTAIATVLQFSAAQMNNVQRLCNNKQSTSQPNHQADLTSVLSV